MTRITLANLFFREFQDFYDKLFIDDPEWSKIKFKGKDWQRQRVVEAIEEYSNKYENWLKINTRDPADNCAIRCICNTDYFIKYGNTLQELKDRLEVLIKSLMLIGNEYAR